VTQPSEKNGERSPTDTGSGTQATLVEINHQGEIQLAAVRHALVLISIDHPIWDRIRETEERLTALLGKTVGEVEKRMNAERRHEMTARIDSLVAEVRDLSSRLGETQAQTGDMRANIVETRRYANRLLELLGDAWWVEAAACYQALHHYANDNTVRGL
jgi:hypothetical protein